MSLPHNYEWRFHLMPGQPGARWVKCRKIGERRRLNIELAEYQKRIAEARRNKGATVHAE